MHLITLDPDGLTSLQRHTSESVYHVSAGDGTVSDLDNGEHHAVITGSMLFVEPNTAYQFRAGPTGAVLIGGPCPPDENLYTNQ